MTTQPTQFHSLTAQRGIAAMGIVLFHYCTYFPALAPFTAWTRHFYVWVDLFFMLSGFIMVHIYGTQALASSKGKLRDFMLRRLARIYPLHLITLFVMIALEVAYISAGALGLLQADHALFQHPAFSLPAIGTHLLLIHSWNIHDLLTWNSPSWSISCEWLLYLLFPWLVLIKRAWALTALGIGSYALLYALRGDNLDVHYDLGALRAFAGFCLGMALCHIKPWLIARTHWATPTLLCSITAIALLSAYPISDYLLLPAFITLLASGIMQQNQAIAAPLTWLGDVSYSLYLWHLPFILILKQAWSVLGLQTWADMAHPAHALGILALLTTLVLALSHFSYHWLEQPARRLITRRYCH